MSKSTKSNNKIKAAHISFFLVNLSKKQIKKKRFLESHSNPIACTVKQKQNLIMKKKNRKRIVQKTEINRNKISRFEMLVFEKNKIICISFLFACVQSVTLSFRC